MTILSPSGNCSRGARFSRAAPTPGPGCPTGPALGPAHHVSGAKKREGRSPAQPQQPHFCPPGLRGTHPGGGGGDHPPHAWRRASRSPPQRRQRRRQSPAPLRLTATAPQGGGGRWRCAHARGLARHRPRSPSRGGEKGRGGCWALGPHRGEGRDDPERPRCSRGGVGGGKGGLALETAGRWATL